MIQQIVSGLAAGSSYALLALGLVMTLKTTNVPNFAMGAMGMLPVYLIWTIWSRLHVSYGLAVAAGIAFAFVLGWVIERLTIRKLAGLSHFTTVLMTIGVWFAVNSVVGLVWGYEPRPLATPFAGAFSVGAVVVTYGQLAALASGLVIAFGLIGFFRTKWGVRMKAVAEDPIVPRLLGVKAGTISGMSWAIAASIATVAVLLSAQASVLNPQSGDDLILNGFVAATAGGFSSVGGAVIGGLALGVIENLAGGYISTAAASTIALLAIMTILLVRPTGLLGAGGTREV
jgi:branched-chain amino acid transport system permease protein